jgi:hypothetical protein
MRAIISDKYAFSGRIVYFILPYLHHAESERESPSLIERFQIFQNITFFKT